MTYDDLVLKHNEYLAYCEAEDAAHAERMSPYRDAIKTILTALLEKLQADKLKNAKTAYGLVYQYNSASVKVDNKDIFLDYVINEKRLDLLDVRAMRKPAQEFLVEHDKAPPGLRIEPSVVARVRDKQTEKDE